MQRCYDKSLNTLQSDCFITLTTLLGTSWVLQLPLLLLQESPSSSMNVIIFSVYIYFWVTWHLFFFMWMNTVWIFRLCQYLEKTTMMASCVELWGFSYSQNNYKKIAQCSVEAGPRCYMKWRLRLASLLFIRFGKVTQGYVKINSLILQLSMLYL